MPPNEGLDSCPEYEADAIPLPAPEVTGGAAPAIVMGAEAAHDVLVVAVEAPDNNVPEVAPAQAPARLDAVAADGVDVDPTAAGARVAAPVEELATLVVMFIPQVMLVGAPVAAPIVAVGTLLVFVEAVVTAPAAGVTVVAGVAVPAVDVAVTVADAPCHKYLALVSIRPIIVSKAASLAAKSLASVARLAGVRVVTETARVSSLSSRTVSPY